MEMCETEEPSLWMNNLNSDLPDRKIWMDGKQDIQTDRCGEVKQSTSESNASAGFLFHNAVEKEMKDRFLQQNKCKTDVTWTKITLEINVQQESPTTKLETLNPFFKNLYVTCIYSEKDKHINDGQDTHCEEEVHDAGVQQRFPPGLRRLERDVLRGLEHGDVVSPQ